MKVSERLSQIRGILNDSGVKQTTAAVKILIMDEIIRLDVEIVEALQLARREGHQVGCQCH